MGLKFSRVGSDPYYANYERAFERLEKECTRLQEVAFTRQKQLAIYQSYFFLSFGSLFALAAAHAAWVKQQPPGTYTWQQESSRVSLVFIIPLLAYLLHSCITGYVAWVTGYNDKKLKRLQESKRKMIKELKDSTHFEKTMTLIQKFDPDGQMHTPMVMRPGARAPPGTPFTQQQQQMAPQATPYSRLKTAGRPTAVSAAAAITSTGKVLLPVFDRLATSLMGDNPTLLNDLRQAHNQLQATQQQCGELAAYSAALRAHDSALLQLLQDLAARCDEPLPDWAEQQPPLPAILQQRLQPQGSGSDTQPGGLSPRPSSVASEPVVGVEGEGEGGGAGLVEPRSVSAPSSRRTSLQQLLEEVPAAEALSEGVEEDVAREAGGGADGDGDEEAVGGAVKRLEFGEAEAGVGVWGGEGEAGGVEDRGEQAAAEGGIEPAGAGGGGASDGVRVGGGGSDEGDGGEVAEEEVEVSGSLWSRLTKSSSGGTS